LRAAHISGALQLLLALIAVTEVQRRLAFGSAPRGAADGLRRPRGFECERRLHVATVPASPRRRTRQASWIFTTTDVIANVAVIVAALLVRLFDSNVPDLVAAVLIALVVLNGAIRILWLR
jgi:hypothetical protein